MPEDYRVPVRLQVAPDGTLRFRSVYVGDVRFTDPFFEDTIGRCMGLPENAPGAPAFVDAEQLVAIAAATDAVEPALFVFHVSRCGSTLLSQLLSVDERCIVLSEVPVLDDILRLPFKQDPTPAHPVRDELLRSVLRVLGRRRASHERYLVVKFDSWHTMFYDRIRRCYPEVPAVLLFRSPDDVVRSHRKQPGMHAVPNVIEPEVFGFTPSQVAGLHPMPYLVRVLERYLSEYLRIVESDPRAHLVSYHAGVPEMVRDVTRITGIELGDGALAAMAERSTRHSKHTTVPFREEPAVPLEEVTPLVRSLYRQLESLRSRRS